MKKVVVLGAGRVGHVIARDLSEDPEIKVTVADRRGDLLDASASSIDCEAVQEDLSNPQTVGKLVSGYDLAVGALPGALGYQVLEGVIASGKQCIDISFMPEDPRSLCEKAKETGSTVIYDFGVAPGMSNLLAAAAAKEASPPRQISIMVGGLPVVRRQPWEYAAPFSPADVLEEYTRPARIVVNGSIVTRPALSGLETMDFGQVGTLEAFYTDGLRSLLDTVPCPGMEEKTLRYPGYASKIGLLRESGFLKNEPVEVNGVEVVPVQLALKLLEPIWHLDDAAEEFTVMKIVTTGGTPNNYKRVTWELLDYTDRDRKETSMARTTGFPAALAARAMLNGKTSLEPGVHPPEALATHPAFVEEMLANLEQRGVSFRKTVS